MITIMLPWPDKDLWPNVHKHWRVKHKAAQIAKEMGYYRALYRDANKLGDGHLQAWLMFHPPDERKRDILDNAPCAMKHYIDGVCEALEIDDSQIKITHNTWGPVVENGSVELRIGVLDG